MKWLNLTTDSPAGNLACDEALLDACEAGGPEVLRFWEPSQYFVVVGYANHVRREVHAEACQRENVPILRRCSGGGTVLQGPGCLNYSLILKIDESGPTESIASTNSFVMDRNSKALQSIIPGGTVSVRGTSDLAQGLLKFSGNAQRRKRRALIFHGTFLLHFDLSWIQRLLAMPSLEPDYRGNRSHEAFLTNLGLNAALVKKSLQQEWNALEPLGQTPDFSALLAEKYGNRQWNEKFP
jgi:lipoate---protein ligase